MLSPEPRKRQHKTESITQLTKKKPIFITAYNSTVIPQKRTKHEHNKSAM